MMVVAVNFATKALIPCVESIMGGGSLHILRQTLALHGTSQSAMLGRNPEPLQCFSCCRCHQIQAIGSRARSILLEIRSGIELAATIAALATKIVLMGPVRTTSIAAGTSMLVELTVFVAAWNSLFDFPSPYGFRWSVEVTVPIPIINVGHHTKQFGIVIVVVGALVERSIPLLVPEFFRLGAFLSFRWNLVNMGDMPIQGRILQWAALFSCFHNCWSIAAVEIWRD
jgi:hypothetical protein